MLDTPPDRNHLFKSGLVLYWTWRIIDVIVAAAEICSSLYHIDIVIVWYSFSYSLYVTAASVYVIVYRQHIYSYLSFKIMESTEFPVGRLLNGDSYKTPTRIKNISSAMNWIQKQMVRNMEELAIAMICTCMYIPMAVHMISMSMWSWPV